MTTIEPQRPTRDEVRDLVKECGLDWQRGFAPLFDGDDTNRYEVLVRAAIEQYAAERVEEADSEIKCLRAERDHARTKVDNAVKMLVSIHSCMYPGAVKTADGRLMVFRPENPHEYMQALSDRIRALPDEMVAHDIGEQRNG